VILGFGGRESGLHNDGINIAAEEGTQVKAADGGVVVYAGNQLACYGQLLLIKHPNGYVTAYAHTKECMISSCVVFTILGVCVIFYFFCIPCLLGVLAVSMCLCPFIPYFNIPLWISLLILLMSGWNLTRGHFSIVWS
jgi:hypothetical protein